MAFCKSRCRPSFRINWCGRNRGLSAWAVGSTVVLPAAREDIPGQGKYRLVFESGRNVLLLDASIADLKINRLTESTVGRTEYFTARSGEMMLTGELGWIEPRGA